MPPPVQPGQVINGKYRIDSVLGEGGMGVVVAGRHVGLGQRVAIKFLHTAMLQHAEVVERFAREARAASKLESDHVARVTDVDRMADGTPFMVMEYLEGSDLATVRAAGQPLPLHVAVDYILEACEAFGEAHSLGIVHRDIKPANLFLAKRAGGKIRVKVLDFGISKASGDGDAAVTRTSSVMGSAHYMSPEQMLTPREVDHRTDIWALGVTLFELTTARLPFPGESVTQVCAMIMSTQPPPPSSANPALPPGFDAVVLKCLGRHPNERFASVAELAAALQPFAASTTPTFGRAPMASLPAVPAVTSPSTSDAGLATQAFPDTGPRMPAPRPAATPQSGAPALYAPSQHGAHALPSAAHLAPMTVVNTSAPVSRTHATPAPPSKAPMIAAALLLGALLVGGSTAALVYKYPATRANAGSSVAPAETAPVMSAPASNAPVTSPSAEASPVATPSAEAPAASSSAPSATEPAKKSAKPSHAPKSASQPADVAKPPLPKKAATNCSPPFTVDAQGLKRAKPECL